MSQTVQPAHDVDGVVSDESTDFFVGERLIGVPTKESQDLVRDLKPMPVLGDLVECEFSW
jgi:hypothetical protein